jgi:hypothetical protein
MVATPGAARFGELVVHVATHNIGFGETIGNNRGKFLEIIGVPYQDKQGAEWCAYFASYCYRKAAFIEALEGRGLARTKVKIGGAKRLSDYVVKEMAGGLSFLDPLLARPGDLVIWHRGALSLPWGKGHVGIVERVDPDGILHTIEGNTGRFPSKVKRLSHDVSKERLFRMVGIR